MTSKIDAGGQGQFDDAVELPAALNALAIAPPYDVRQGSNFIDEEGALDLALTSDEDENDDVLSQSIVRFGEVCGPIRFNCPVP